MNKKLITLSLVATLLVACDGSLHAAPITITSSTADGVVSSTDAINTTGTLARVGKDGKTNSYIAVFQLPTLDAGTAFTATSYKIFAQRYSSYAYNADLYGLGYRTSPVLLATDKFAGPGPDPSATLIQDDFLDTTMSTSYVNRSTDAGGSTNLDAYLNAMYAASATDRGLGQTIYVFLRLSPDNSYSGGTYSYYQVYTADNSSHHPALTYDTALIPEPATMALLATGAAALLRRRRR